MKKQSPLFIAVISIFILTSCSKDKTPSEAQEDPCTTILEVQGYRTYSNPDGSTNQTATLISYDEKGRVKTVKYGVFDRAAYTYYKDSIEVKATDAYNKNVSDTYYLDNAGRVVRTKKDNINYRYDADGYLIWFQLPAIYDGPNVTYHSFSLKYEDGNIMEVLNLTSTDSKTYFEYYPELHQDIQGYNSPLYMAGAVVARNAFYLIRKGFFGKQSKNLLETIRETDGRGGELKYKYDSKGRILEITGLYRFIYQCP